MILQIPAPAEEEPRKMTKEFFADHFWDQVMKGDMERGRNQGRSQTGCFAEKPLFECSWQRWLKRLFLDTDAEYCECRCNRRKMRVIRK